MTIIELCVDDAEGARIAARAGADRIELARDLSCGGLTPEAVAIAESIRAGLPEGVRILVREKPVGFHLSREESAEQAAIIARLVEEHGAAARRANVPLGFVVGGLIASGIDLDGATQWRESAQDYPVIFHRAFDELADPTEGLEILIDLGFDGVLTSGGRTGAASVTGLRALVKQAAGRIAIIGSGGVRSGNAAAVVTQSGIAEVHFRAPAPGGRGTDADEASRAVSAIRALR